MNVHFDIFGLKVYTNKIDIILVLIIIAVAAIGVPMSAHRRRTIIRPPQMKKERDRIKIHPFFGDKPLSC